MKLLLDENFPAAAARLLRERGHECLDVRGTPDEGADDDTLFRMAQAAQAALLTTDKDFFHTIPLRHPEHAGIVVVALRCPNRQSILEKLTWLLDHVPERRIKGRVFLLREKTCAVYPRGSDDDEVSQAR